ncbi:MAG TPA: GAF domain-containing protein [bacterium]|nr:GAF domain-containing protein [bacterium]
MTLTAGDDTTAIFALFTRLLATASPDELATRIIMEAVALTGADGGSLFVPEPDGSLIARHAWSPGGQARVGRRLAPGEGVAGWVAQHGEAVVLNAARTDPRFTPLDQHGFIRALLAVPLALPAGRGVLALYAGRDGAFTAVQQQSLTAFGTLAALAVTRADEYAGARRAERQFALALAMCRTVLASAAFEDQGRAVCAAIAGHLGYARCSVSMVSEDGTRVRGVAAHGLPSSYIRATDHAVADLPGVAMPHAIGRCAARGETILCRDRSADPAYCAARAAGDPQRVFSDEYLCVPLRAHDSVIGVIVVAPLPGEPPFTAAAVATLESFADVIALALLQARTESSARAAYREILSSLAAVVETRDAYTGMHAENVLAYATALARAMSLPAVSIEGIQLGAILHDVGKVAIADMILRKPGELSGPEADEMHRHAGIGAILLAHAHFLQAARAAVRHHHERWDGSGYPDGLAGEAIPLPAQIVAVADAYDAMTSDRPYRRGLPVAEARARLRAGAGTQFNPRLVDAFLALLDRETQRADFRLAADASGHVLWLAVTGTLTLDAGRAVLARAGDWLQPGHTVVVIDLTAATAVTDPGSWLLLRLLARCHAAGATVLVAANDDLRHRLPVRVVSAADARRAAERRHAESAPAPAAEG